MHIHFWRFAQKAVRGRNIQEFFPPAFDGPAKNYLRNVLLAHYFRSRVRHARAF
jgi:hypothetical protein